MRFGFVFREKTSQAGKHTREIPLPQRIRTGHSAVIFSSSLSDSSPCPSLPWLHHTCLHRSGNIFKCTQSVGLCYLADIFVIGTVIIFGTSPLLWYPPPLPIRQDYARSVGEVRFVGHVSYPPKPLLNAVFSPMFPCLQSFLTRIKISC